jgi:hypothetical protein
MKNIHLLPTEKATRLFKVSGELKLTRNFDFYNGSEYQHIYITSDEEVKEGDYFWKPDCNMIFKAEYTPHKGCQKVILTTDTDLIANGVQAIDDEFLEWFVKNPSCEEVVVDKPISRGVPLLGYKIILPQEESKQETHEEIEMNETIAWELAKKRFEEIEGYAPDINNRTHELMVSSLQEGILAGAKWQAERMYSEEVELINWLKESLSAKLFYSTDADDLIDQFKKK